jgi:hypothetical protein
MLWHHVQRDGLSPLHLWGSIRASIVKTFAALDKRVRRCSVPSVPMLTCVDVSVAGDESHQRVRQRFEGRSQAIS